MTLTYGSGRFSGISIDITALLKLNSKFIFDFFESRFTFLGLSVIPVNFKTLPGWPSNMLRKT